MLTYQNYFERTHHVNFDSLPQVLKETHQYVDKLTNAGKDWSEYLESDQIKESINLYFEKIAKYLRDNKQDHRSNSLKLVKNEFDQKVKQQKKTSGYQASKVQNNNIQSSSAIEVEHIDEEIKFIKRYVGMQGKLKSEKQLLNFINSLQRSILEKKIRLTSTYSEQIKYIQDKLLAVYNSMGKEVEVKIDDDKENEFLYIIESEKVRISISYIRKYISLQGKVITKEKAQKLYDLIIKGIDTNQISVNDPYIKEVNLLQRYLKVFLSKKSVPERLQMYSASLQGWQDALNGCGCGNSLSKIGLSGIDDSKVSKGIIVRSDDFSKYDFKTHGFTGEWLDLIGDPSIVFSTMIYGPPKNGKSRLALRFAGYLSKNFGDTLYTAKEEQLGKTLQSKLVEMKLHNPRLHLTDILPSSLGNFRYVFLDSVTSMGLKPVDLLKLREEYPQTCFIYIFQTRKDGQFRGDIGFQHDVDVVIEVSRGIARQMGRFNQGGEMDINEMPMAA